MTLHGRTEVLITLMRFYEKIADRPQRLGNHLRHFSVVVRLNIYFKHPTRPRQIMGEMVLQSFVIAALLRPPPRPTGAIVTEKETIRACGQF